MYTNQTLRIACATILSLSALVAFQGEPVIDGLAAATTTTLQPSFFGKVLSGPDILNGARLLEGQTVQLQVTVQNPWTNNVVKLDFSPKLQGAALSQQSTAQSRPSWVWTWTPPAGSVKSTSQTVTFLASFVQNDGTAQLFKPQLAVALGVHAPPVFVPVAGQDVQAGQTLSFEVAATDPESEDIAITGAPLPEGATLTAAAKSGNKWVSAFSWTPTEADIGAHAITFVATDTFQVTGNASTLPVTVTVHAAQTANDPAIVGVKVSAAKWNAKTSKFVAKGQIVLAKKAKLPGDATIQLRASGGAELDSPGALVSKIAKTGAWSASFELAPSDVPCTLEAQTLIGGAPSNTPGTLAVTGAPQEACAN